MSKNRTIFDMSPSSHHAFSNDSYSILIGTPNPTRGADWFREMYFQPEIAEPEATYEAVEDIHSRIVRGLGVPVEYFDIAHRPSLETLREQYNRSVRELWARAFEVAMHMYGSIPSNIIISPTDNIMDCEVY